MEQILIAKIHPVVSLYRMKGAIYGYSSNVINFEQNIQEYINKLPIPLNKLPLTFVFNKRTKSGIA